MEKTTIYAGVFGVVVGDALGVPVQFEPYEVVQTHPVTGMRGYGVYNLPPGSWSDDSSLTLCLLESLTRGLDYDDIMRQFVRWETEGFLTPYGFAFDQGGTTMSAIGRAMRGVPALSCGDTDEYCNGNGSLMRIMPMVLYLMAKDPARDFFADGGIDALHAVSSLTHGHPHALMACGIYAAIAQGLLLEEHLFDGLEYGVAKAKAYYTTHSVYRQFYTPYLALDDLGAWADTPMEDVASSGYVVHTLYAALWCLMNTETYNMCVLKAVNLGDDTDTTAAVAGGLAGLYYGFDAISTAWIEALPKHEMIRRLCDDFVTAMQ